MIAAVPQLVLDAGVLASAILAVIGVVAAAWRTPPVKWLLRQLREDREERMLAAVKVGTEDIREAVKKLDVAVEEHRQYVHYHLGPNGTTKPVHQRLCDLESAAGVED